MVPTRGEHREDAVLRATLELLAEIGYGSLTMDAVAARAKASKATIYRRWSGKAELVIAAIERHTGVAGHPELDSCRPGTIPARLGGLPTLRAGTDSDRDDSSTDARSRTGSDTRTGPDPGAGPGARPGTGTGPDTGTSTGPDTGTGPDTRTGTGTLRGDLLGLLRSMRDRLTGESAALVLGLLTAMRDDAALAAAVRGRLIGVKRDAFAPALRRAAARGEIAADPDHELVAEVASALLFSRLFVTGEPLDDAFLDRLADAVILPLVQGVTP
ncbi:TetR/AcrR family transcriptional regulator [Jiangella endophytica]|uniref:TetR/AcrR family transcriptional regulator n=1 Tax=Jiangella endophytica TaxID=1623398 RepID=UPI0018E54746|nr:TetR/AcrR family transcriptional regulator [Jiangella endophytica]